MFLLVLLVLAVAVSPPAAKDPFVGFFAVYRHGRELVVVLPSR